MFEQIVKPNRILVVNQNALANSVKAMILEGFGMGWLPISLCRAELDAGQLTIVDDRLAADIEVRIYRNPRNPKPTLQDFWTRLAERIDNPI
jgi:DNA-binding transcriptional LysR family regulator